MAKIKPFAALRPDPALASKICELPYDVMSSEEARVIARDNPLSFLHISKPDIDLPPATDLYSPQVYAKGAENFARLIQTGALRQDPSPFFYLYRQIMGAHSQIGWVAAASCEDYLASVIKKHELTRPDKEDDRVRHIETLNSQTGPVFLAFRSSPALTQLQQEQTAAAPEIDFTAPDGVRHSAWVVRDPSLVRLIEAEFAQIPALYIADGHHRSAAAARVFKSRHGAGHSAFFLSVIFPHDQLRILPYNRVLKDWNSATPDEMLQKLNAVFTIEPAASPAPTRKHDLSFYSGGRWLSLRFRPELTSSPDPIARLDVTILQNHVLAPLFGIQDPRTSKRINFVGGIRGPGELKKLVDAGEYVCAFSMFPTSIEDLMVIADAGGLMPPKSTWFEPKLRDAMFSHLI